MVLIEGEAMSFWENWSDGKKWGMGILSALIITSIISAATFLVADFEEPGVEIPGGTGWVFAGYFNMESGSWTGDGPYVAVLSAVSRSRTKFVEVGDVISLNVSRPVVILDFKASGTQRALEYPIRASVIDEQHLTGVTLPAGTELIVRDLVEGYTPGRESAALWLRVVPRPE